MRVTTIQSWVYLATIFGVGVAAAAFAVFYQVPTKVTGEGILLIKQDAIAQVRAQATGRLIRLRVKLVLMSTGSRRSARFLRTT